MGISDGGRSHALDARDQAGHPDDNVKHVVGGPSVVEPRGDGEFGSLDGPRGRQLAIAEMVIRTGSMSIDQLAELNGVSSMTIYRDIAALEERGILQRHRGQVVAVASGLHEVDAEFRLEQAALNKQTVAASAARLIRPGSSVMMDDSTSGIWLLRALEDLSSITIVTNSLQVANEVTGSLPDKLIITGGEYQPWARALLGPTSVHNIRSMHADFCVMSASAVLGLQCFHPYAETAEVKRAMLDSATVSVMLLDHSKFTRQALFEFADLTEFTHVVVDDATPQKKIDELREAGVNLTVAGPAASNTSKQQA